MRILVCSVSLLLVPQIALARGGNTPASPYPTPDRQVKVWTNEDVEALGPRFEPARPATTAPAQPAPASRSATPVAPEKDPRWYAQQLAPLEAELENISNQASALQQFRATGTGLPTGLNIVAPCEGYGTDNFIAQLEARRQEILGQIDALADTARLNGMPPGILVEGVGLASVETPLTPQQQDEALVARYQSLLDQLGETRSTISAMHADVASQGATLQQPDARWGGNLTTNLLEDLYNRQSTAENEISAAEDEIRRAGLRVQ
jgi:hypothetical protein